MTVSDEEFIQTNRPELYDLQSDPGEFRNLAESSGEKCQEMRNILGVDAGIVCPVQRQESQTVR